jgi:hypothetical protein
MGSNRERTYYKKKVNVVNRNEVRSTHWNWRIVAEMDGMNRTKREQLFVRGITVIIYNICFVVFWLKGSLKRFTVHTTMTFVEPHSQSAENENNCKTTTRSCFVLAYLLI